LQGRNKLIGERGKNKSHSKKNSGCHHIHWAQTVTSLFNPSLMNTRWWGGKAGEGVVNRGVAQKKGPRVTAALLVKSPGAKKKKKKRGRMRAQQENS